MSCEEAVPEVQQYVAAACPSAMPGAEKEHVMVCVQIQIDGRNGVMLADPGYHVPRIITVMADGAYPHTGKEPSESPTSHAQKPKADVDC